MHYSGTLGECAGNGVDGGKLAYTVCRDQCTETLDSSVAISGIASVQLIGIANPDEPGRLDIVKKVEVVVSWHAMHSTDAKLLETSK